MKFSKPMIAAAMCSTSIATPGYAQTSDIAETVDDNVIIVTATRRAEDVQDIPLAVTAVNPVQLERQNVVNVTQISQISPSFSTSNAQNASGSNVLRIRGVGTTSNNIGFESAVGIFIDGAYQSRPGVALNEFVDVERVEVLRGPQGTLFGRNTSAGALNITNRRPDLSEFGGFVNATYGNYDHISLQGAINAPIVKDSVAFRLTGAYRERDGFVDVVDGAGNLLGGSNEIDQYLVRGQIGFETGGGIEGRLIADYSKSTATCCSPVELFQSPVETGGLFALVGLGPRGGMAAPVVATNPFDQSVAEQALDNRIATQGRLPSADIENWGITGEVTVPLGGSADLIYIGSYREFDALESADNDFSGIDVFRNNGTNTQIETMTHELRIQGDAFDGALSWMVGGYYSDEDISQTSDLQLGADYDAFTSALLAAATAPVVGGAGIFFNAAANGLPGLDPRAPYSFLTGVNPAGSRSVALTTQSSQSWSIFTHNTLEVADGLKLTLGLRYSDESKDGSYDQLISQNGTCPGFLATGNARLAQVAGAAGVPAQQIPGLLQQVGPTAFVLGCFPFVAPAIGAQVPAPLPQPFTGTFNDDELIYTVKLGYEFAAPINVYASFTHGYKSGGFNLDATAAVNGADPTFASEEVDSYEIGMKGRFLDNAVTLNIALFYQEFSNFQVLEFTGAQFQTFNVPKVETTGFEIESFVRPTDGLTFNLGLTYVDARYPGDCAGNTGVVRVLTLCGNSLTNAPEFVAIAGATYERDIGSDLKFFVNGQVRAESDRRTSTQVRTVPNAAAIAAAGGDVATAIANSPLLPFDVQDGNIKINLRAGIGDIDDAWGLEAWVTNLTNETTRGVTFSTTLRSGSRSTFPQEPRMYGLTLRGKF